MRLAMRVVEPSRATRASRTVTPRAPRPTAKSTRVPTGTSARRPASGRSGAAKTSGARRPARGPAKAAPSPKAQRGSRATNRLVILLIVVGALVISYGSSLRTYLRQSHQIDQLVARNNSLRQSLVKGAEQLKRGSDSAYIEQQARLRFGWVMPGQTPYVVLGPDGQPLNTSSELNASPPSVSHAPVAWWSKEAASLVNADNPPVVPKTSKPTPSKKINGG